MLRKTKPEEEKEMIQTYNMTDYDVEAEKSWEKFSPQCLKWAPSAKELLNRWYRHRFTKFVSDEFRMAKQDPPRPLGSEELFFKLYPYLEIKWLKEKKNAEAIEPSNALLLDRWFRQRKYEFKKNWLKKHRSGDKFNYLNQKNIYANRHVICNFRPRMAAFAFRANNISIICILVLLILVLWTKSFKFFKSLNSSESELK